jgi:hypothetical protein
VVEQRQASIVRYWRAVEMFTPGTVRQVDHGHGQPPDHHGEGIYRAVAGEPLTWQPGHRIEAERLSPRMTWQHLVYGGIFGLDLLQARMEKIFGASDLDFDERLSLGDTALFTMVVDAEGRADLDSLVLSTAAWGLGRAEDPGPGDPMWLDGFENVAAAHRDLMDGVRSLEYDDLQQLVAATAELLGLTGLRDEWEIRIRSRRVPLRRPDRPEQAEDSFLNSFHLEDLDRVASAVAAGNRGPALEAFLTEDDALDVRSRRDVRRPESQPVVRSALSPSRIPAGRWPAKASHPLAASQQLAVGEILTRLSDSAGIFAVNGPPAPERPRCCDLIAVVVVARADRLAACTDRTTPLPKRRPERRRTLPTGLSPRSLRPA